MKPRPIGFVLLAFLFGWLAVAGIGNAAIQFSRGGSLSSSVTGLLALAYAAAAGFTAFGLWRVREWVVTSLRLWMLVCAVLLLWFPIGAFRAVESPLRLSHLVPFVVFSALIAGLFWLLDRYVTRIVRPAA